MTTHTTQQSDFARWSALLEYCHFENTRLKNRLAMAMETTVSGPSLRLAEHFQQEFLRNDEVIRFLREDLRTQQQLAGRLSDTETDPGQFARMQQMLGDGIRFLDKDFRRMQEEFDQFLIAQRHP